LLPSAIAGAAAETRRLRVVFHELVEGIFVCHRLELDLAIRSSASSFLSQSLETLLATLQKLRNASLACATSAKQIREGVQLAADLIQAAAERGTTLELNPTILPFLVGSV
jgi:hypothetical protein